VRILLDTHILLWWLDGHERLRPKVRKLLADGKNELLWSAASTWELAIKAQLGKVRLQESVAAFVSRVMVSQSLTALPIQHLHAAATAELPMHHRDPFDRLLVAQADIEGVPLLTGDERLRAYDIERIEV
jgi:PIN domain nuclease of toxin-antitoxin system